MELADGQLLVIFSCFLFHVVLLWYVCFMFLSLFLNIDLFHLKYYSSALFVLFPICFNNSYWAILQIFLKHKTSNSTSNLFNFHIDLSCIHISWKSSNSWKWRESRKLWKWWRWWKSWESWKSWKSWESWESWKMWESWNLWKWDQTMKAMKTTRTMEMMKAIKIMANMIAMAMVIVTDFIGQSRENHGET